MKKASRIVYVHVVFEKRSSSLIGDADKTLYFHVSKIIFDAGIKIKQLPCALNPIA